VAESRDKGSGAGKKVLVVVLCLIAAVGGFFAVNTLFFKKNRIDTSQLPSEAQPGAPGLSVAGAPPKGEALPAAGPPAQAAPTAAAPGSAPAPSGSPAPGSAGAPGTPVASAPSGEGAATMQGQLAVTDFGDPLFPFKENPFASKRSSLSASLPMHDPADVFAERGFPRPRKVRQPVLAGPEPIGIQPAGWFVPNPTIPRAQPPKLGGESVRPVVGTSQEEAPRVVAGGAQSVGAVGPRVTRKPPDWSFRRVSGILHDGVSLAIIEVYEGDKPVGRIVKPGDRIRAGGRQFTVRAIGADSVSLRETGSTEDVVVRLRGVTANEG